MDPTIETGRAIDLVRAGVTRKTTGCWTIHVPGRGPCRVYLMEGELIAAHTGEDAGSVLNRLVARGRVSVDMASSLQEKVSPHPVEFSALRKFDEEALVGRLMSGRFRDNLIFYLFDGARFSFEPMETVRVPFIQLGHDSPGLLRELEVVHGQIMDWMDADKT